MTIKKALIQKNGLRLINAFFFCFVFARTFVKLLTINMGKVNGDLGKVSFGMYRSASNF